MEMREKDGVVYFEEEIHGVIVHGVAKDKREAMGKIADLMYPPEEEEIDRE